MIGPYLPLRAGWKEGLSMWFDEAVIYQIYPLGLCGAPKENDGVRTPRILRCWTGWTTSSGWERTRCCSTRSLTATAHGYDTRDYFTVDPRLGSDEDLAQVCRTFHQAGIPGDAGPGCSTMWDGASGRFRRYRRKNGTVHTGTGST